MLLVSALLIVAVWLPVVLVGHSTSIAGERYWWLGDDAMISMRYARNLANGFGLVWNPSGERVEGYTNFLWTLYMAFVHLLPIPTPKISLVILLTNILLAIALIPVIIRLTRILGGDSFVTAATVAGYVLNEDTMFWTTAGFETPLLSLLFLLAIYRVIKEAQQGKPRLLTFLLVASISLVRADALVLSGLVYLLALLLHTKRKLVGIYSALSLALPLAHEIFRILYYGDILPNTAYLKTSGWDQRYKAGLEYVAEFARDYFVVIGLAVVGVFLARQRMQLSLLAAYLAYVAYIAYIGGDAFPHFRFFVPVLPLLL
ncbi:MAG: hypothetical protein RML93_04320, partial [Anaerolineales bacterium]|nr:hypothetical protein [Anaerolineales bacterium]MDW8446503.1 hypothetical protein [Anaerolineales bacterium]